VEQHAEAPASFTVKYFTTEGFNCMLTLRGESGAKVLPAATAAIGWLIEHGCTPTPVSQLVPASATAEKPGVELPANWCPIHQVEMRQHEKNGQVWYSHKDGEAWCRGKVAKAQNGGAS
jgi:hypothetical protein